MTLAYFLFWITYIQLDSTFAQVLSRIYPKDAVFLFALTWIINTVMIVVGQLPIAHLTQKWSYQRLSWVSALSMAAGFLVLACFLSTAGIVICIVLVTLGEILMSPMGSALVARIAPPELRTTYYGALNLGFLGAGLAPILGSACLTFMSPAGLFFSMTLLLLCMLFAMLRSVRYA
jgi:MFS family permease